MAQPSSAKALGTQTQTAACALHPVHISLMCLTYGFCFPLSSSHPHCFVVPALSMPPRHSLFLASHCVETHTKAASDHSRRLGTCIASGGLLRFPWSIIPAKKGDPSCGHFLYIGGYSRHELASSGCSLHLPWAVVRSSAPPSYSAQHWSGSQKWERCLSFTLSPSQLHGLLGLVCEPLHAV